MRSMPTEIKKNRPDDQMTSCFLKLYTPTRVCEIIIRNWSAGQLVTLKTFVYCAACYAAETSSIASGCYPDIVPPPLKGEVR